MSDQVSSKTALITGAAGLLGRCLDSRLAASGWKTVALPRTALDITREDDVRNQVELARPALVFNCAATPDVDRCEREPDMAYAVNEQGPLYLARASKLIGAEFVHVSTDYVFDGSKSGFYTQEDAPRPLSVYAKSKLAGEKAARSEYEKTYIIRTSWIFGAGGKNFGSRVVELARSGAHLKGVTDQTSIPTYAPDLAARIEEIVALHNYDLYQVTSSGPTTWYEFARLTLDLAGMNHVELEPVTRADLNQLAPRPHNSAMRCLVSERMGFEPLRDWRDTLQDFLSQQP